MLVIFENHADPGFRYEGLMRTVFGNCKKYGDPWGYACQEFYNNFAPTPQLIGKRAISIALCKLIIDNKSHKNIKELIDIENLIWDAKTQEKIIEIIDRTVTWVTTNL